MCKNSITVKRVHKAVIRNLSPKHQCCYAREFAGRHGNRGEEIIDILSAVTIVICSKRFPSRGMFADGSLLNGVRG